MDERTPLKGEQEMMRTRLAGTGSAVVLGLVLAGCSASAASNGSNGGGSIAGSGGGGRGTVTFMVTVNWSGPDPVQGTFTDSSTGSGFDSCSQYATATGVLWLSPSTNTAQVQGKSIGFAFDVSATTFHGPGTYADTLTGSGVSVGSDNFTAGHSAMSSVTVKADGSGSASFTDLFGLNTSTEAPESGTITWTCSG
jgi:hypothetical protein